MENQEFDLYDDYYNEFLTQEEVVTFEKRINEDENFKEGYKKYLKFVDAMLSTDRHVQLQVQNDFAEIKRQSADLAFFDDSKVSKNPTAKEAKIRPLQKFSLYRRLSIAASILLLIAAAFFIIPPYQIGTDNALADNSFLDNSSNALADKIKDSNPDANSQGMGGTEKEIYYFGLGSFIDKDSLGANYKRAIEELHIFAGRGEDSYERNIAYYFIGESYRQLKEYGNAIESYLKINDNSKIYDRKYMSLGIVYYLNNEKDKAIAALKKVAEMDSSEFKKEAQEKLDKLK